MFSRSIQGGQPEISDHSARTAVGRLGENNISALQVAVDHALSVRLRETRTNLPRDVPILMWRQLSDASEARTQGLTRDELHGEELDFAEFGLGRVQLKNFTHVEVADFARCTRLGRQAIVVAAYGSLQRYA